MADESHIESEPKPRRPATLQDIADAAGVSVATASFVANRRMNVRMSSETRSRVQDVIDRLGYRPNALAKNLVQGTSKFIGLVADAIATTPFAGETIRGAQDAAWRRGYVLLVANTEGNLEAERKAISMMLEHRVRGILYSTWYHRSVELPPSLSEVDSVTVNCFSAVEDVSAIVPNEIQGGDAATTQLLELGHERIAFINTTWPSPAQSGRLKGYSSALARAGIDFDSRLVIQAQPDEEGGYATGVLLRDLNVSSVFCHNDRVAMGLYDWCREHLVSIPDDLSIVGFDSQDVIAAHLRPPLTTIGLPHYELGAAGVEALLDGPADGTQRLIEIDCPVVSRQSVAAALLDKSTRS